MSSHRREELDGHSADSIFDEEELSDGGGVRSRVEEEEEEEGWLPDDEGGGAAKRSSSGSVGCDVVCPECGKLFKNDKAMFGHLRSHPNRGYRGATPPVNKLKLSGYRGATPPVNKLKLSPERAAAAASPSPSSPSRLTPYELICTYSMITLQCEKNRPMQQLPPPRPSPVVGAAIEQTVYASGSRGKVTSNAAADLDLDEYSGSGSVVRIPTKRRNVIREEHRKKAKLAPLPPPPSTPKEKGPYICKHCSAEFSTHQALGGHMAGHHRDKKVPTMLNDASSRAHQDGRMQAKDGWRDSGLSLRRGQLSMASNVPRRQSGQASGGQMIEMRQRHSSGRRSDGLTLAAPAPAPAPAPALTQADVRGGRRMLNIDLNAEATEEE